MIIKLIRNSDYGTSEKVKKVYKKISPVKKSIYLGVTQ